MILKRRGVMKEIKLPELGEEIKEVTVSFWYHKEGDTISSDENLVEFYSDKANFSVKAPFSGKLVKIRFKEGAKVKTGEVIGEVE